MSGSAIGSLLTLAAAACWATYTAFAAPVLRRHSPLVLTTWATVGGTHGAHPARHGAARSRRAHSGPEQCRRIVPIVLGRSSTRACSRPRSRTSIVFNGVRLLGPTRIITLQSFVPADGGRAGLVFLREPIRPAQVVGGAIIVLGVALTRRASVGRVAVPTLSEVAPPVPPLEDGAPPLAILVDYDGTIALTDVTDRVMAKHAPGIWEEAEAEYAAGEMGSRRLMAWEMSMIEADPAVAAGHGRRAAPRRRVRAVRPARAGGVDPDRDRVRRVRVLHRTGARAAGRPRGPRRDGADRVPRSTARAAVPERPPDLPRLRDLQAAARARPSRGGPAGRVHRRRRQRSVRRRLQRHRVRQELAGTDLPRGRLGVPAMDGLQRARCLAGRNARGMGRRPVDPARAAAGRPHRHAGTSAAPRSGATVSRIRRRGLGRHLVEGHGAARRMCPAWARSREVATVEPMASFPAGIAVERPPGRFCRRLARGWNLPVFRSTWKRGHRPPRTELRRTWNLLMFRLTAERPE